MKKNIITLAIVGLMLGILPVLAQSLGGFLVYGSEGAIQLSGTADQIAAMNHDGNGQEMKTLEGKDATVAVTGAAGLLELSSALAVQKTSSTGTVTAVAHSLVELTGVSPAVALPSAVGCAGDHIVVVNIAGSGSATFTTQSSQTINGASAGSFAVAHGTSADLISDGLNWVSTPVTAS